LTKKKRLTQEEIEFALDQKFPLSQFRKLDIDYIEFSILFLLTFVPKISAEIQCNMEYEIEYPQHLSAVFDQFSEIFNDEKDKDSNQEMSQDQSEDIEYELVQDEEDSSDYFQVAKEKKIPTSSGNDSPLTHNSNANSIVKKKIRIYISIARSLPTDCKPRYKTLI